MSGKLAVAVASMLILMSTFTCNIQPVKSQPKTWTVDDDEPADFHTIQEAINAANSGDTIFVRVGTYHEHILVNKTNLSLLAENKSTIIDGDEMRKPIIYIEATGAYISGFTIQRGNKGITNWGGYAVISNNIITHCAYGIYFEQTAYSPKIINNAMSFNIYGIYLAVDSFNATFCNNEITENSNYGIWVDPSGSHVTCGTNISGNLIANNRVGMKLWRSDYGTIIGNHIANNTDYGVDINYCFHNEFCHNSFINNTLQARSWEYCSSNIWDYDYPSGGNYWSDYTGVDADADGIGDTSLIIDANNTDRYPLMAPFTTFDAGTWNGKPYTVDIVSNSSVSNFQVDTFQKTISFNVTCLEETAGFCRITIPNIIAEELWQGNYTVLLNGEPCSFRNWTDATNTYIYVNYTYSEHQIIIITEFPSPILLPLLVIALITAAMVYKRKSGN
jgi:parallel beta-helix repeat protein